MGFGKQSVHRPTALGTLLQAATYGATIPNYYGCARGAPLAIWAANLRPGHSTKKFKSKKGPPAYVENIDMLLGANPIQNVLQIWSNQSNYYPLNFVRLKIDGNLGGSWNNPITIADPYFYAIIAMTLECSINYDITFDDYGAPGPVSYRNVSLPLTKYEFPMWNGYQHGPDLNDPNLSRFPYYFWKPGDGPTFQIPYNTSVGRINTFPMNNPTRPNDGVFGADFFIYVYYAQLSAVIKRQSPLTYNRFVFENVLGNGTEYADAGLPGQQRLYKAYAGVGSSDMDLGTTASIPSWRMEVCGTGSFLPSTFDPAGNPRGDAEYADILEDIFKSGMLQTGDGLGLIQRGLNCLDMPGVVQKNWSQALEPSNPSLLYPQPNNPGSVLLGVGFWSRPGAGTPPTIVDTQVNTWLPAFVSTGASQQAVWYVDGAIGGAGNLVDMTSGGGGFPFGAQGIILEFDQGSQQVDGAPVVVNNTGGGTLTASITTTGDPGYLVAVLLTDSSYTNIKASPQWKDLLPVPFIHNGVALYGRKTYKPGTYTFSYDGHANLNTLVLFAVKSKQVSGVVPYPKTLSDIVDFDTLMNVRLQCRSGHLQGALCMDAQRKASDWLKDLYMCMNAAPVWGGFRQKSIAYSEVSVIGDGSAADDSTAPTGGFAACFLSPTANGPVADLTDDDLIADGSNPPVVVGRKAQVDANNILQVQHFDRNNKYNQATVSEPESGAIYLYGPRKLPPTVLNMIVDPTVARKILAIQIRRKVYLRNTYKFKVQPKFLFLEAMDLITVTEPRIGLNQTPLRLTSVKETKSGGLECEAENFIYGLHYPNNLTATIVTPNVVDINADPGSVNTPIFLEPPTAMTVNEAQQLWIPVSSSNPNYGGCNVFVSTDGGASYGTNPIFTIFGKAVTGILASPWPAGLDPDFVNDLVLDLSESLGSLASYPLTDENNFVFPFYVEGSTTCGYELGTYSTATLTSAYHYTLPASPNGLRRAVYHQPLSGSVSHAAGKRFAFLGAASVAVQNQFGDGSGIAKLALQPTWVGQTLFFKFQAFNIFGAAVQDLADCTPYSYAPGNCAIIPSPEIVTIPVTSPAPGNFTVAHGLLATPLFAIVQMTSSGDIWLQRPLSVDGTNVYLTASDTGLTANVSFFYGPADASVPLSPSAGGAYVVPHGLASTPTLGLVQMDSSGDIWKGTPPYTSTDLNLIASDAGITGKDYAWVTAPRTPTLTRFISVALAPGAPGNFTVPHGLLAMPKLVIVRMSGATGGKIWLQLPSFDGTNLFLTASDGGITGEAGVWG